MAGNDVFLFGVPSDPDKDDVRLYDVNGPALGVNVTLAAQEAGSDVFAGIATIEVRAGLAVQEAGADTFSGSATVAISATLAAQETGQDTFSGSITVEAAQAAEQRGGPALGGRTSGKKKKREDAQGPFPPLWLQIEQHRRAAIAQEQAEAERAAQEAARAAQQQIEQAAAKEANDRRIAENARLIADRNEQIRQAQEDMAIAVLLLAA